VSEGKWGEVPWGGDPEDHREFAPPPKPLRCLLRVLNSVKQNNQRNYTRGGIRHCDEPLVSPKKGYLEYTIHVPLDEKIIIDSTDTLISKEHRPGRSWYL
jgi:hypothetical protein